MRGARNLELIAEPGFPADKILVAGVIDGRNIWAADLEAAFATLRVTDRARSGRTHHVSASCSLQHVPYDVELETRSRSRGDGRGWPSLSRSSLEIATLTRGLNEGRASISRELAASDALRAGPRSSPRRRNPVVRDRARHPDCRSVSRGASAAERAALQQERIELPALPTTTIGSFPQTGEVRATRRAFERGEIDQAAYDAFIEQQIRDVIAHQEALGLDVLVHGEPERNDMVQYFGEQLDGFAFTRHGWVQSYGSRYVRPPVIYGDVSRPAPMTVRWATFAQSLSDKPVKGMLTGPVTILNWSFVRDDQPRSETCRQIALAIRDEVADLDAAGIAMIQIDEAALREGLPLHRADWDAYLEWAVECFRITAAARDRRPRSTRTCATRSSGTSSRRSAISTPM